MRIKVSAIQARLKAVQGKGRHRAKTVQGACTTPGLYKTTQSKDSTRGLNKTMQKIEASPAKREIQGKDNTMQSRGSTSQCMVQKIEGSAEG